jgi:hypothetical protein
MGTKIVKDCCKCVTIMMLSRKRVRILFGNHFEMKMKMKRRRMMRVVVVMREDGDCKVSCKVSCKVAGKCVSLGV